MTGSGLGIVVIGRNEGERLRLCLESSIGRDAHVVYVDSGSTDGSVELARSLGAEVVELDLRVPFTAARSRNAGFARLLECAPGTRWVQFVDGDCELIDGWLDHAAAALEARDDVAVVCGRLRERDRDASLYNRMCDLEWDTPTGEVDTSGGIFAVRRGAFEAIGGFDPTIVAGEEPEMCRRLRAQGWKVLRVADDMAWHDAHMLRLSQWWRRQIRSAYGEHDLADRTAGALYTRTLWSARAWSLGWPLATVAAAAVGGAVWGSAGAVALAGLCAAVLPLQVLRVAYRIRPRAGDWRTSLGYGALTMIAKWPQLWGQILFRRDRHAGRLTRSIEYK